MIYADNAATTKLNTEAFKAMKPYLLEQYGNASQPYLFAKSAKNALKSSRKTIALCIGASPEEIYFTSGGTESDNWAIKSVLYMKKSKRRIVTSQIEHHAVLNACRTVETLGIPVEYVPVNSKGILSEDKLKNATTEETGLVSIMFANNEIGTIEPIAELVRVAHSRGALFHTDAVQALGHIPIDVKKISVDMLSSSAHKFNGPKGIGFLYVKNGIPIHPYVDGGAQENGKRAGTENIASIVGMATALKINIEQISKTQKSLRNIEDVFMGALRHFGLDIIRNGADDHLPGNINISFRDADGEMLLHRLDLKGICVSTGSACDSVNTQVSHVLKAINVPKEYADGTIRVTFGAENTEEDAINIAKALEQIITG